MTEELPPNPDSIVQVLLKVSNCTSPYDVEISFETQIPPDNGSHLELAVFYKAGPNTNTDPNVRHTEYFPRSDFPGNLGNVRFPLPAPDFLSVPPPCGSSFEVKFENMFFWQMRMVDYDEATGQVTRVYPARHYGVETELGGTANGQYFTTIQATGTQSIQAGWVEQVQNPPDIEEVGTIIITTNIPQLVNPVVK
jgi:hypothetical protein